MVKELTLSVKELMKESSPAERAALLKQERGERILSSVKVFKPILSPQKARKIKPCAVLMKEMKVFTPICIKNKKYREIGRKKKNKKNSPKFFHFFHRRQRGTGKTPPGGNTREQEQDTGAGVHFSPERKKSF